MNIAMIAHDEKKVEMMRFAVSFKGCLVNHDIVATGTTGSRLNEFVPELKVSKVASGPLGGDAQIAAMIVEEKIDAVLFFIDPLSSHPHDPDINGLIRLCVVYNVPLALNYKTAEQIIENLVKNQ
jgi:methylglyoxal synthase